MPASWPGRSRLRAPRQGPRDAAIREQHGRRAEGQIDEKYRAPAAQGGQRSAEHRAGDLADGAARRPDRHGARANVAVKIRFGEQSEHGRQGQRGADSLKQTHDIQLEQRPREAAQRGRAGEKAEPGEKYAARAEKIAQRAAAQQQTREHHGVTAAHPLQPGDIAAEFALNRRQRDVHNRRVENDHEKADGGDDHRRGIRSDRDGRRLRRLDSSILHRAAPPARATSEAIPVRGPPRSAGAGASRRAFSFRFDSVRANAFHR